MKNQIKALVGVLLVITLSSCAVNRKLSFENNKFDPPYPVAKSVLATFQDKRAIVVDGSHKPGFCGYMKSTVQIPYFINTSSGKPLAEEFTQSVVSSMQQLNINAAPLLVTQWTPLDSILQSFKSSGRDVFVLLTINNWIAQETPTAILIRYEVIYDLSLAVYNASGAKLAQSSVSGRNEMEKDIVGSVSRLQTMARETFKTQLTALFTKEEVKAGLQ